MLETMDDIKQLIELTGRKVKKISVEWYTLEVERITFEDRNDEVKRVTRPDIEIEFEDIKEEEKEPTYQPKLCNACKHGSVSFRDDPCRNCLYMNKWEPK